VELTGRHQRGGHLEVEPEGAGGEGDDELEHAIVKLLAAEQKTLATAEWGSGGMIAHWLSEVPESRDKYLGGVVTNPTNPLFGQVTSVGGKENTDASRSIQLGLRLDF
jgi:hypothetical protein